MPVFVRWFVFAFSLVLVAAALPLVRPDASAALSQAPAYALFHLIAALVGFAAFGAARGRGTPAFALVFGLVDLYQAAASWLGWFPRDLFRWTPADDLVHLVLGAVLVAVGVLGLSLRRRS